MAKQERVVAEEVRRVDPIVPVYNSEVMSVLATGLGVGLVVAGAMYLLERYVFGVILCQNDGGDCAQAPYYSMIVAMLIGAIAGLVALVQIRVYRPLLAVIAATTALWGVHELTTGLAWYWAVAIMMLLFGLSYLLFAWIARIRAFIPALIVTIVLVIAVRLVFGS